MSLAWLLWSLRINCNISSTIPPTAVGGIRHDPLLYLFLKDHQSRADLNHRSATNRRRHMKRRPLNFISALSILLLVAFNQSVLWAGAQTPQRDNRPRTASIGGRVTVGGAPAANALVMVTEVDPPSGGSGPGGESRQRAFIKLRTENDGRYRATGLAEGDYMI